MSWIKRNLLFAIFSALALALVGLAGYYAYSQWTRNNTAWDSLNSDYEALKRLNSAPILPGDSKINNIDKANEQTRQLLAFIKKTRPFFQPITPIPSQPRISDQDFSTALGLALNRLQREATNNSVILSQPDYSFSFQAERTRVSFASAGLPALAVQLGDIKAICDVLFEAKVNSLDNIRRERVSADDASGSQSDYLTDKAITNELAVITPYEITFKSFSGELATVLSGFAGSPHGLLVKAINVKSAPPAANEQMPGTTQYGVTPLQTPTYTQPAYTPSPYTQAQDAFRRRYGLGGASPDAAAAYARRYGRSEGGGSSYQYQRPIYVPTYQPTPQVNKALPTVLDEKQLQITLDVVVVKLRPSQSQR
jgi:hypothetical protein